MFIKKNVSPDNVFLFETLHWYNTQETYLFDTRCYFVIYQQFFFASIAALCTRALQKHHELKSKI